MDLEEFVSTSLQQIMGGIKKAQKGRSGSGVIVPHMFGTGSDRVAHTTEDQPAFMVQFDVAVTAKQEAEGDGSAKLQIASFVSVGGGGSKASSNESVSRLQFGVPVVYPKDPNARPDHAPQHTATEHATWRTT